MRLLTAPPNGQHGAAACRRATTARVSVAHRARHAPVNCERIVNANFVTCIDRAQRSNKNPAVSIFCLAIRRARMIDPTRRVARCCAINDAPIAEIEEEGMIRIGGIGRRSVDGDLPIDTLTDVLEEHFTSGQVATSKYAAAMDRRAPHNDAGDAMGCRMRGHLRKLNRADRTSPFEGGQNHPKIVSPAGQVHPKQCRHPKLTYTTVAASRPWAGFTRIR